MLRGIKKVNIETGALHWHNLRKAKRSMENRQPEKK